MAKDGNMSLITEVVQPFRRIINPEPPKDKLAAGKLDLSDSNQSIKDEAGPSTPNLKRRLSQSNDETPKKFARSETGKFVAMSPWQCNKLQGDLIAAKTEITKMRFLLEKENTIRKEMQIVFDNEKDVLLDQQSNLEESIKHMKIHLDDMRQKFQEIKADKLRLEQETRLERAKTDKELMETQREIHNLNDKILQNNMTHNGQLSEMKKDLDEVMLALSGAQAEVEIYKSVAEKQTARAEQCNSLKIQVEKQSIQIMDLTNKLQTLEYEKNLYGDWEHYNRATEKRLLTMADLEKEVVKLRERERFLKEMVKNKLVLDEKVHTLTAQLTQLEPLQLELEDSKMRVSKLESSLDEWVNVARIRGVDSASALSALLTKEDDREQDAVTEASDARTKIIALTEEVANLTYEKDKSTSALSDMQKSSKTQETLIRKLQKRVLLLSRERDCYREQLDCYEKDLTMTVSGDNTVSGGGAMSNRVQQLEKTVQGYRELLEKYDNEDNTKVVEKMQMELSKTRDEAAAFKCECSKLEAQKDALQGLINKLTSNTKVLHLAENPAAMAQKQVENDLATAQEEIKTLKAQLREGAQVCPEEMSQLKHKLDSSKIKLQRMKEEFTSSAQEYRDVCYMLLGYKIDRVGHKNYKISSMYAESANEYLTFTLNGQGIEMVSTEYSDSLSELVELHLSHQNSFPMFLSALTSELFSRTTMQVESE